MPRVAKGRGLPRTTLTECWRSAKPMISLLLAFLRTSTAICAAIVFDGAAFAPDCFAAAELATIVAATAATIRTRLLDLTRDLMKVEPLAVKQSH